MKVFYVLEGHHSHLALSGCQRSLRRHTMGGNWTVAHCASAASNLVPKRRQRIVVQCHYCCYWPDGESFWWRVAWLARDCSIEFMTFYDFEKGQTVVGTRTTKTTLSRHTYTKKLAPLMSFTSSLFLSRSILAANTISNPCERNDQVMSVMWEASQSHERRHRLPACRTWSL